MCHCCLEAPVLKRVLQPCSTRVHLCFFFAYFCCDAFEKVGTFGIIEPISTLWLVTAQQQRQRQLLYWVDVTPAKRTPPPPSQPGSQSLFFFVLFFSLCQTAYGEINWWVHAGNRVAIETSHIRLEFVTRGKKKNETGEEVAVLNAHWRGIKGGVICNTTLMPCFISSPLSLLNPTEGITSSCSSGLDTCEGRGGGFLYAPLLCVINIKVDTFFLFSSSFSYETTNRAGQ